MPPSELRELLPARNAQEKHQTKPFKTDSCLVCWDAPLTRPRYPDIIGLGDRSEEEQGKESLTTREIERTSSKALCDRYRELFDRARKEKGVSVLGFSGLSHWVVSRNVLGLPRVGRFGAPT